MISDKDKITTPLMILKDLEDKGLTITESLTCLTVAIAIGFNGLISREEGKYEENIDNFLQSLKKGILNLKDLDLYNE